VIRHGRADLVRNEYPAGIQPAGFRARAIACALIITQSAEESMNIYDAWSTNCCGDDCPCPPGSGC
jgi:hypothetical protein